MTKQIELLAKAMENLNIENFLVSDCKKRENYKVYELDVKPYNSTK